MIFFELAIVFFYCIIIAFGIRAVLSDLRNPLPKMANGDRRFSQIDIIKTRKLV